LKLGTSSLDAQGGLRVKDIFARWFAVMLSNIQLSIFKIEENTKL
jgi:hypothetical protein